MAKLPSLSGKALLQLLAKAGFVVVRTKGSHHFLRHADGRTSVVPVTGTKPSDLAFCSRYLLIAN
jgi:predicted RNA binding protein YcfA (HicA-like mRNA interferase family)